LKYDIAAKASTFGAKIVFRQKINKKSPLPPFSGTRGSFAVGDQRHLMNRLCQAHKAVNRNLCEKFRH
jgi:hypothetical protein